MSPSSRKMAHVEFSKSKPELISKDERKRQKDSLRVYKIGETEGNESADIEKINSILALENKQRVMRHDIR